MRFLAVLISLLLMGQQVFSSNFSKHSSASYKKRKNDFDGDDEQIDFPEVTSENENVDKNMVSCLKKNRIESSSSSRLKDHHYVKIKTTLRSFHDRSGSDFEDFDGKQNSHNTEELIKKVKEYRRKSLRFYLQSSYPSQITVKRSEVFQSIYGLVKANEENWYNGYTRFFIEFEGENGFDRGGLTNECIELLIESFIKSDDKRTFIYDKGSQSSFSKSRAEDNMFDFTEAFFIETSNGIYVPNTKYPPEIFKFIGSIFALAFCLDIQLGIEFLPAFYRTLTLERISTFPSAEAELEYIDKELFSGLIALRKIELEPLKLEFMGNDVTRDNLEDFIDHEANSLCHLKYKHHLDSLKEGFFSLLDVDTFEELNIESKDLLEIMRGEVVLTADDFVQNVNVTKLTDPNSRLWIFEIIEEFSDQERLKLFKFITAKRIIPFKGLKNLMQPISFVSIYLPNPSHLPTASTCGSMMKIPVYSSKDVLKEKLLLAINSCETFELE